MASGTSSDERGDTAIRHHKNQSTTCSRVGDWQQSRDPFRTRGPSEVVVFTPQKVSQGVDPSQKDLCSFAKATA